MNALLAEVTHCYYILNSAQIVIAQVEQIEQRVFNVETNLIKIFPQLRIPSGICLLVIGKFVKFVNSIASAKNLTKYGPLQLFSTLAEETSHTYMKRDIGKGNHKTPAAFALKGGLSRTAFNFLYSGAISSPAIKLIQKEVFYDKWFVPEPVLIHDITYNWIASTANIPKWCYGGALANIFVGNLFQVSKLKVLKWVRGRMEFVFLKKFN